MWQPILMVNGFLISILGVAMLVPAGMDLYVYRQENSPFVFSAAVTLFIGLALFLANKMKINKISLQQGYLLTVLGWFALTFLATLPFMVAGVVPSFADALFEVSSGLSTTGATIFADLERLPKSILLWRSIVTAIGGIGIVIFAAAMLPFLGIGGMQIFQRENSDTNEKFMPKFSYIAKRIVWVYVGLTVLCMLCLFVLGMGWFDAVNHAMAAISTSGFSTKNSSIGAFNSAEIEMAVMLFMILGALPMTFYIVVLQGKDIKNYGTSQIVAFFKVLAVYIAFVSIYLVASGKYDLLNALRYSSFNIVSIVTTTGFVSTDYMQWGSWVGAFFVIFALTGGCTGSTSGSIKILRWQVIIAFIRRALILSTDPNRVLPLKVGGVTTDNSVVSSVFMLFCGFIFSIGLFSCLVAAGGYDFEIAFSSVVACITNSGPGLGKVIGPAGNYSSLSEYAKYVLAVTMLVGRLEVVTVLTVLTKSFWSKN